MSVLLTIREAGFDPREWPARLCETEAEDPFALLRGMMVAVPMSLALWALIILPIWRMLG